MLQDLNTAVSRHTQYEDWKGVVQISSNFNISPSRAERMPNEIGEVVLWDVFGGALRPPDQRKRSEGPEMRSEGVQVSGNAEDSFKEPISDSKFQPQTSRGIIERRRIRR